MKTNKLNTFFLSAFALLAFAACNNDDNGPVVVAPTCSDGIMNGTETGIDCGGSCDPCEMAMEDPDFSGTFAQADHMGRPGINTVLNGDEAGKNSHNVTLPADMQDAFQGAFLDRAVALHGAYGVEYENNILGLDAVTLTTVLADDVLEVAPNNLTTYFLPGEDADGDGNVLNDPAVIGLTGRTLQDDVIDVSLILIFGGMDGIRFSGQDTDGDGTQDLPILNSDSVGFSATVSTTFPYLGNPE